MYIYEDKLGDKWHDTYTLQLYPICLCCYWAQEEMVLSYVHALTKWVPALFCFRPIGHHTHKAN